MPSDLLFTPIVVGYGIFTGVIIPVIDLNYVIPPHLGTAELYARKSRAIREGAAFYSLDSITDHNGRKSRAAREGMAVYSLHLVCDHNARESRAIREGAITYFG